METVSILQGNRFAVSDLHGDIDATPTENHGLFANDTRFLSRWVLEINGVRPTLLTRDDLDYFKLQFFYAVTSGTVYIDSKLSAIRSRSIDVRGLHERIRIMNHANEPVTVHVRVLADADFADLFEVKDKLEKKGKRYRNQEPNGIVLGYERDRFKRETRIIADKPVKVDEQGLSFQATIPPHAEWDTVIEVACGIDKPLLITPSDLLEPDTAERSEEVNHWVAQAPHLECTWTPLENTYARSLLDLAALRFHTRFFPGALPAAGLPWFMAIFGRDSLIASFQALPFYPELAATTLSTLALFQGRRFDAFRDEEPGKILHELRLGEMTAFEERPHSPYYGTADATPLFLILLEEYERWTGHRDFVKALELQVRAAVDWIDRYGDRDGDGYIEYERRNTETGLENQCWKDSWDAIAFANGELAPTPRATCELQGYAYDAKLRVARLARDVFGDPEYAARLESEARELKLRFNTDFWLPERKFFALGLDGRKRKIDSLTSNIGHLLWSGIVDDDKAPHVVRHLMSDNLFSGWGIRTMAESEQSYNPIGYHVGTVWPHDSSLVAWGLRKYGYQEEAARLSLALLEAATYFRHRLPEAFAGYPRESTKYPVEYPTACSPQAWAAGAPLMLVRTLLGLDSDGRHLLIDPALPVTLGRIELLDIRGPWGKVDAFARGRELQSSAIAAEE